jgi:uncharacterized alkaline shock family protein YloU
VTVLQREPSGSVTVSSGALASLVVRAAQSVDGVRVRRPRRHLEVQVADGRAHVELELAVRMGVVLPEAARSVQERVADVLGAMCEVAVDGVDVAIEEVA